eukprot:14311849-Alexandrium_andersonii.AAC.1
MAVVGCLRKFRRCLWKCIDEKTCSHARAAGSSLGSAQPLARRASLPRLQLGPQAAARAHHSEALERHLAVPQFDAALRNRVLP